MHPSKLPTPCSEGQLKHVSNENFTDSSSGASNIGPSKCAASKSSTTLPCPHRKLKGKYCDSKTNKKNMHRGLQVLRATHQQQAPPSQNSQQLCSSNWQRRSSVENCWERCDGYSERRFSKGSWNSSSVCRPACQGRNRNRSNKSTVQ